MDKQAIRKKKIKKLQKYCVEFTGGVCFEEVSDEVYEQMRGEGYEGEKFPVYNVYYEGMESPMMYIGCITTDETGVFFFSPIHDTKFYTNALAEISEFLEELNAERVMN